MNLDLGELASVPLSLKAMNDDTNLYLLVQIDFGLAGNPIGVEQWFTFDSDNDGTFNLGDDYYRATVTTYWSSLDLFDGVHDGTRGVNDPSRGGTIDVAAGARISGSTVTLEVAHPLDDADDNDFSLSKGDVLRLLGIGPNLVFLDTAKIHSGGWGTPWLTSITIR